MTESFKGEIDFFNKAYVYNLIHSPTAFMNLNVMKPLLF